MTDDRQLGLFEELAPRPRSAPLRRTILYPRAVARRQTIEKMTRRGCLVREIASAASCTVTHVLRVRKELRAQGRLPETPRTAEPSRRM